ncbi:kelch-like protein 21 isoform X1 [Python bivittatus]|uniref:Kelch-like protein 21 isoform X1 n=2 Tax=Python bivittatus TaxID=176946 RepID=A0A9F2R9R6_PYTBI|nr:kelch-like protein 21 isoform X1 [Python bivittatus]
MDPSPRTAVQANPERDAILEVGEKCFLVNRWALARHSCYFEAMFFGGTRESVERHIRIGGIEAEPFQALLDFTRTGSLCIAPGNVASLLQTADFLRFEAAKRRCEVFLERELHVSNCLSLRAYAQHFACVALASAALNVALTHWADVVAHGEVEELPKETLRELLQSDELFVAREDLVFDTVMQWVVADLPGRAESFLELVGLVRVPFLSLSFLDHLVKRSQRPGLDAPAQLLKELDRCPPPSWKDVAQAPCVSRSYETLFVVAGKRDQEQQELFHFLPKAGVWRACSPLKRRNLTQYAVAAVGNFLFVTGGNFREEFFWAPVDWVLIYNSWDDSWQEGPAMKEARNSHCAVGVGFHLYVMGGSAPEGITPSVERLALADSSWEPTSPLIHPVERAGAAGVGTRIYVVCGLDENGDVCRAVQRLDVETDMWDVVSFSPLPRYDLCVAALNGAIYTIGGGAFRFDVCTDEWTPVDDGLAQKFFEGCSTANGRIYLLAERRGNAAVPNMVILDPYKEVCQEVDHKLLCPLPIHGVASVRRFDTWV